MHGVEFDQRIEIRNLDRSEHVGNRGRQIEKEKFPAAATRRTSRVLHDRDHSVLHGRFRVGIADDFRGEIVFYGHRLPGHVQIEPNLRFGVQDSARIRVLGDETLDENYLDVMDSARCEFLVFGGVLRYCCVVVVPFHVQLERQSRLRAERQERTVRGHHRAGRESRIQFGRFLQHVSDQKADPVETL